MNFVMFVFLFGFLGPQSHGQPFATMEECETERRTIPAKIAEHNASENPVKIVFYSSACVPVKKAPQGKEA